MIFRLKIYIVNFVRFTKSTYILCVHFVMISVLSLWLADHQKSFIRSYSVFLFPGTMEICFEIYVKNVYDVFFSPFFNK